MRIIAIDTAASACSAAVIEDNKIIARFGKNSGKTHSQEFLPETAEMLNKAGLTLAMMDAVAVTAGPGSFTGIRIGLATAKAWGQALGLPIIPIITLDALAYGTEGLCCPILDARKNEVYTALYRDGKRITEYEAKDPYILAQGLWQYQEKITFTGDAVKNYDDFFREKLVVFYAQASEEKCYFMAEGAAFLAAEKFIKNETVTPAQLDAVYLRLSEAEQKRLENEKQQGVR